MITPLLRCALLLLTALPLAAQRPIASRSLHVLEGVPQRPMERWVDSVYQELSPRERLGQLIMPIIYPVPADSTQLLERLKREQWGGILFQKGLLSEQRQLTLRLQQAARPPLLIALDGEWGLYMRLKDAPRYPRSQQIAAASTQLLEAYGREVARQCRLMGIHINFAPVLDVNSNPHNPVIGTRSFGSTVEEVKRGALAYARGLESGGVLSVAKHFPGHGDTSEDSHKTLPSVNASKARMETLELAPFRSYFAAGYGGVMTAHLRVPAYDPTGRPASLSRPITTDLLQRQMGFKGLIFTDALEMKGAQVKPGESLIVAALLAGNDILLGPPQPQQALRELEQALSKGEIPAQLLEDKCKKILRFKYALIVHPGTSQEASPAEVKRRIWTSEEARLRQQLEGLSTKRAKEQDPTAATGAASRRK
ncbi:glycoside hydrolase family 3 protein [Porphyromonas sp.]